MKGAPCCSAGGSKGKSSDGRRLSRWRSKPFVAPAFAARDVAVCNSNKRAFVLVDDDDGAGERAGGVKAGAGEEANTNDANDGNDDDDGAEVGANDDDRDDDAPPTTRVLSSVASVCEPKTISTYLHIYVCSFSNHGFVRARGSIFRATAMPYEHT